MKRIIFTTLFFTLLAPALVIAQCNYAPQPLPTGMVAFYVVAADGQYDPLDPLFTVPDGDDFDTIYMGRTPAQATARRDAAVAFFLTAYGIDFSGGNTAQGGAIELRHEMTDPRQDLRIWYSGDNMVQTNGWVVNDGYYKMIVVAPGGATFYGQWGGAGGWSVPQNSYALFGEYQIEERIPCINPVSILNNTSVIEYQSLTPTLADDYGREYMDLQMLGIPSTNGIGYGRTQIDSIGGGLVQAKTRLMVKYYSN